MLDLEYILKIGADLDRQKSVPTYLKPVRLGKIMTTELTEDTASVTKRGVFDMQVCVPDNWDDDQVTSFANSSNPCGTTGGWSVRKEGDKALNGDSERVQCEDLQDYVHIMLDA